MKPNSCPQCGEAVTTLWRPTKKVYGRIAGYGRKIRVCYVPVFACLRCMIGVRILKLGDHKRLLANKPRPK
jgi:hypothetical protein